MSQPGFFDLGRRFQKLNESDPLVNLDKPGGLENFRITLAKTREKEHKSNAGRKPFDEVLMF